MHALAEITPFSITVVAVGVIGTVVYVLSPAFAARLRPIAELLIALRPLSIPLLVAAAAATVNSAVAVQLLAAVALVLVVGRLIIRPELANDRELKAWKRITGIALVVVGVVVVLFTLTSVKSILSGQAGPAGAFLVVALVALGLAGLARLASYGTAPLRWPVIALLLLATWYTLAWAGIVGANPDAGAVAVRLFGATAIAVGVAIAGEWLFEGVRPPAGEAVWQKDAAGVGLSLALIAGVLVMFATTLSLIQLTRSGGDSVKTRNRGPVPAPLYADDNKAIEYEHAPVLAFNEDQRWTPIPVHEYFTDYNAHVVRKDGSRVTGGFTCPSIGPRKCLRVTIDCPSAADPCATPVPIEHERGDHISSGQIYVRVLRRKPPRDDDPDDVVARRGLFEPLRERSLPKGGAEGIAHKTQVLLEYWFFYPYDEWTTKILGASFTQRHEGDWESVSVGLGEGDKPLYVAYSAHCGGSWRPWADTVRYETHPLVAVARGSHGNYPNAGAQRPPDFTSCTKLPRGIGTLLAFAANIRDVTADRWEWGADRVEKVDETEWPMSFPGTWGGNDIIQLKTRRSFPETPTSGAGPASPPLQPLWQDPIRTIFCDRYWDHPEGQNCKQALRPGRGQ